MYKYLYMTKLHKRCPSLEAADIDYIDCALLQHCRPLLSSSSTTSFNVTRKVVNYMSPQQRRLPVPRQQLLSRYSSLNKQVGTVSI